VQRAIELAEPYDLKLEILTAKGNLRQVHAVGHANLVRSKVFGFFQVITDLTMPELNGVELARQFHLVRPELQAILMSGYSCSASADKLREAGIQEVLEQPMIWTTQAEVVARVLS
jgi:DNA-binding NtrC family response regulator